MGRVLSRNRLWSWMNLTVLMPGTALRYLSQLFRRPRRSASYLRARMRCRKSSNVLLRVLHDPGHGGRNSGVVIGELVEKDYTLQFAKDVYKACQCFNLRQALTRSLDDDATFGERNSIAEGMDADLVLIYHINAIYHDNGDPNPDVDGLMTFVMPGMERSKQTAEAIGRAAPRDLLRRKPKPIPVSAADWTSRAHSCLKAYKDRDAVLIELGFATSPIDRGVLLSDDSRIALVSAIMCGVGRFCELSEF